MKCAIMQPTYLPWSGYFNLIQSVDKFVFLDDVQFEKQSWQSRNRLVQNGQEIWLSIPIKKHALSSKINQISVNQQQNWQQKHLKSLRQAYAKSPYIDEVLSTLEPILFAPKEALMDYTIPMIKAFSSKLGLDVEWCYSSEISTQGNRSKKLLEICQFLDCNQYLSPVGSKAYIEADGVFAQSNITVMYQCFQPVTYSQVKTSEFVSHLSIVDVIANIGFDQTRHYIKSVKNGAHKLDIGEGIKNDCC